MTKRRLCIQDRRRRIWGWLWSTMMLAFRDSLQSSWLPQSHYPRLRDNLWTEQWHSKKSFFPSTSFVNAFLSIMLRLKKTKAKVKRKSCFFFLLKIVPVTVILVDIILHIMWISNKHIRILELNVYIYETSIGKNRRKRKQKLDKENANHFFLFDRISFFLSSGINEKKNLSMCLYISKFHSAAFKVRRVSFLSVWGYF